MKWISQDYEGNERSWYSEDVIEKIKDCAVTVLNSDHCCNCDGVGYYDGCNDIGCGTYQANKILDIIEGEG